MTHVKSHDGISPYQNLSDERGLAEQRANRFDTTERHDDDEDIEVSEKCGDSQSEDQDDAAPEVAQDNEPATWEEAPSKMRRNPADPTPEQRARHDATHLPFRPWCPVCVEARGTEDLHYRATAEEQAEGKAQICIDYCEIGDDLEDKTGKQEVVVARETMEQNDACQCCRVQGQ